MRVLLLLFTCRSALLGAFFIEILTVGQTKLIVNPFRNECSVNCEHWVKQSEMMWTFFCCWCFILHLSYEYPVVRSMWNIFFGRGVSFMLAYRCGKQHQRSTTSRNGNSAKLQVWMIGTNRLECRKVWLRERGRPSAYWTPITQISVDFCSFPVQRLFSYIEKVTLKKQFTAPIGLPG